MPYNEERTIHYKRQFMNELDKILDITDEPDKLKDLIKLYEKAYPEVNLSSDDLAFEKYKQLFKKYISSSMSAGKFREYFLIWHKEYPDFYLNSLEIIKNISLNDKKPKLHLVNDFIDKNLIDNNLLEPLLQTYTIYDFINTYMYFDISHTTNKTTSFILNELQNIYGQDAFNNEKENIVKNIRKNNKWNFFNHKNITNEFVDYLQTDDLWNIYTNEINELSFSRSLVDIFPLKSRDLLTDYHKDQIKHLTLLAYIPSNPEDIEKRFYSNIKLKEDNIDWQNFVDYNGNTAWHFIAKQSPIMFNYLSEDKDKFLSIISVKNNKGESPLSILLHDFFEKHYMYKEQYKEMKPCLWEWISESISEPYKVTIDPNKQIPRFFNLISSNFISYHMDLPSGHHFYSLLSENNSFYIVKQNEEFLLPLLDKETQSFYLALKTMKEHYYCRPEEFQENITKDIHKQIKEYTHLNEELILNAYLKVRDLTVNSKEEMNYNTLINDRYRVIGKPNRDAQIDFILRYPLVYRENKILKNTLNDNKAIPKRRL